MKHLSKFTSQITSKPEDTLKRIKRECFYKAKSQYKGKKPFGMYWGMNTCHLKTLSDWTTVKSIADQEEKRGKLWFKEFMGHLKIQPWQK